MNDLLENAKRNSKITLEEFFFEFYYNTLTAVAAPYNVNVIEEIQRSWGIFGYPIAFNITEFPDSEFRNFLFTGDSVIQELDTPVDLLALMALVEIQRILL